MGRPGGQTRPPPKLAGERSNSITKKLSGGSPLQTRADGRRGDHRTWLPDSREEDGPLK